MTGRLSGYHVLVTGGAQGIGAAIVRKALAEGGQVTAVDRNGEALDRFAASLGHPSDLCRQIADMTDAIAVGTAHDAAVSAFGAVTGLVNNAGRNSHADPVTMTETEWDAVFAVDLKAAWICTRAVLPGMIAARRGAIVNIASVHADQTFKGYFPYAAAKSGLVGLTRSLALEVGEWQVRVNALSPGWTATELVRDDLDHATPGTLDRVIDVHPLGRIATSAELANCAAFLLSDEASFVTGANWRVDGGLGARFAG